MAILANQKVLTHDYWKTASQLVPGDFVFNKDGVPVEITSIQHYRAEECYRIVFEDHLCVEGDQHLGLLVETPKYRNRVVTYKGKKKFRRKLEQADIKTLLDKGLSWKWGHYLSVQTAKPLQFATQDLPVPPFVFGFWFFNRRSTKRMAAPRGVAEKVYQEMRDAGYKVTEHRRINTGEQEFSVFPKVESHLAPFIPTKIPNNYLLASAQQRIELLKGILHSKSRIYSPKNDRFRFSSTNRTIIFQLQWLLESLGHKTRMDYRQSVRCYTLFFKSKLPLLEKQKSPPFKVYYARRFIEKIEPIGSNLCVHIETKDPDNGIVVGEGFITCR